MGIGIGRKFTKGKARTEQCVRFYVEMKIAKQAVPKDDLLPEQIGGIPTDVIQTGGRNSAPLRLRIRSDCFTGQRGLGLRWALLSAAIRLAPSSAGTFGAVVEAGGKLFILSNNHVLANEKLACQGIGDLPAWTSGQEFPLQPTKSPSSPNS